MIPKVFVYRTADKPPVWNWNRYYRSTPDRQTIGAAIRVAPRHLLSVQWSKPRPLMRETTANPRAAVCPFCPSWIYGLTQKRARRKLDAHMVDAHPRFGCGAAR